VGVADLGFQAIGTDTMREYWPVFAAAATLEFWLVRRIRRSHRFPVRWIASAAIATVLLAVLSWAESYLATQLIYQTVGEGARVNFWQELRWHFSRSWPLIPALGVVVAGLVARPRSETVMAALVAAAGVLASWIAAMWLFTTSHQEAVFQLLVLPGGLGVVASLIGFPAATALWMAIARWIWGEGRRRRRRLPPRADAAV
jgi:hypothetical protein